MEEQDILLKITGILQNVLKRHSLSVSMATTASDIDGWDSLSNMMIIDSIEKNFNVKFKFNEIMKFNNVGDIVACVKKKTS